MYIYFLISLIVVFIDWVTKFIIHQTLSLGQSIHILPFFNIVYVRNNGISFSLLTEAGPWILTTMACLISVVVCYFLIKEKSKFSKVCFALILGGAVGNIIDRICLGSVIDFLDFYINDWHWPAFNIADSAICIGVALLICQSIFMKKEKK